MCGEPPFRPSPHKCEMSPAPYLLGHGGEADDVHEEDGDALVGGGQAAQSGIGAGPSAAVADHVLDHMPRKHLPGGDWEVTGRLLGGY